MLRRKPTAITLTTEDVAIYEDARAREALLRDELRSLPGDRAKQQVKSREERLGLVGGGGNSRG
ncbi:hypothetical protein LHYA1_G001305 [Lachnellula hyalina]|uniref:Anaphase-promoting complex subunit CDC26 n=1 Tax=Lachnellula hyalina TaxID=1316788 RepID=A0A8H8RAU4_9HELO|nr:uncharacterized protein LHYA1_G001305 [Lachnellula hyalina]TVY29975.1 hypothetical protein LHYA1_G001305 [Lachnellula hyalina]